MSAIVPFDFSAPAVALGRRRANSINADAVMGATGFPVLSIKGKVFALVKDSERKVLTRVIDGEEIPVSNLPLAVVRANTKARVFYGKSYVEGESDGTKPSCFSHDGVAPDPGAEQAQAKNCQLCPHAVWGSKLSADGQGGKGTACAVNTRLAVVDPAFPTTPFLLRVPAGSRSNFSDAVKLVDAHGKDYNEAVFRVSFDKDAPSPKLTFRPNGMLGDDVLAAVRALWNDPVVLDIVGVGPASAAPLGAEEVAAALAADAAVIEAKRSAKKPAALPAPAVTVDEDDVAAVLAAPAPTKPKATKAEVAAVPAKAAVKPAPVDADDTSDLLNGLRGLLGNKDD